MAFPFLPIVVSSLETKVVFCWAFEEGGVAPAAQHRTGGLASVFVAVYCVGFVCWPLTMILNVFAAGLEGGISGVRGGRTPWDSDIALGSWTWDSDCLGASWGQGRWHEPHGIFHRGGGSDRSATWTCSGGKTTMNGPNPTHTTGRLWNDWRLFLLDSNAYKRTECPASVSTSMRVKCRGGKR